MSPSASVRRGWQNLHQVRESVTGLGTGMPWLDAEADFRRARRAWAIARIGRPITRQENGNRPPALTAATVPLAGPARLEMIAVPRIVGTVEPTSRFDARFRPAAETVRHRWERIALAHRTGTPLPPIEVLERPDGYYVFDGRHRVSVARALGRTEIEAWVSAASHRRTMGPREHVCVAGSDGPRQPPPTPESARS
jgi:hypothetical protein